MHLLRITFRLSIIITLFFFTLTTAKLLELEGWEWQGLTESVLSNTTLPNQYQHQEAQARAEAQARERAEAEYARLQHRLSPSDPSKQTQTPTWNLKPTHPRHRLLTALHAFRAYKEQNLAEVRRWRDLYKHVPKHQKRVLEQTVRYTGKLNTVEHLVEHNDELAQDVVAVGMEYYGISDEELEEFGREFAKDKKKKPDRTSVVQAMKHFVRDWSGEGVFERKDAFGCVLDQMDGMERATTSEGKKLRVLVPGAGAGRLGYEIEALGGFEVTLNEYSSYMNLIYRYATQITTANSVSYHPYIDWWSHHFTTTDMHRAIHFPDSIPDASSQVIMVEGDFTTVFTSSSEEYGSYDVLVTLFFIDTARNLMAYLETIHRLLRPGGTWINLGPVLYGTGPWVQLSVEEIVKVSEALGFVFDDLEGDDAYTCGSLMEGEGLEIQGKVRSLYVPYGQNPRGLSRNAYDAQFWRARKL
ncbi:N2227-like protein-domain-containing protein [Aspergillus egyptiacus]|nr:N2227-like protein-domain-containing protein [Aspergillus egyptiacus]